jgi:hypothetical protein
VCVFSIYNRKIIPCLKGVLTNTHTELMNLLFWRRVELHLCSKSLLLVPKVLTFVTNWSWNSLLYLQTDTVYVLHEQLNETGGWATHVSQANP